MRIRTGTWRISKLCRRTAAAPVRMSRFCRISPSLRPSSRSELAIGLLRSRVENSIAAEALLTEEQAQQFYQANQDSFKEDGGMKVAHILVDSEAKAQDIIKQLQAGADFAQLAQSESILPEQLPGRRPGGSQSEHLHGT